MTAPGHVHPRQRTVGVLHPEAFEDAMITVDHIYVADGSFTCDDCGGPGHDPGMVGLLVDTDPGDPEAPAAAVELTASEALLLADRLTRAAHLILESAEDRPDVEREAARYAVPDDPSAAVVPEVNPRAAEVWKAWNALGGDPANIRQIARNLGMDAGDVAAVIFPSDKFGPWHDSHEPDLP